MSEHEIEVPEDAFVAVAMRFLRAGGRVTDFVQFAGQDERTQDAWARAGDRVFVERALVALSLLQGDVGPVTEAFGDSADLEGAEVSLRLTAALRGVKEVR